MTRIS